MSKIDYFLSSRTLDTRSDIANPFIDLADIDFVERDGDARIHFSNGETSGFLDGSIDLISSRAASTFHGPTLNGDELTVWNAADGGGWTRDTYHVAYVDEFDVLGDPPDPRIFEFGRVELSDFLETSDLRDLVCFTGDDVLFGGLADDYISGHKGDDIISGENGADTVRGGRGDDSLRGQSGDDQVMGGRGDDLIFGEGQDFFRTGVDTLTGGSGDDTFRFAFDIQGGDTITDFRGRHDTLSFVAANFTGMGPDFDLVVGVDPTATDDVGTFLFDQTSHVLSWDGDGSGNEEAVVIATLEDVTELRRSDFELI